MGFAGQDRLISRIASLRQPGKRLVVAVIGAPGSGKSTIAEVIRDALIGQGVNTEVLAMDGFHYDDAILNLRGQRARKGAPETFDVDGFAALLDRLRANTQPEIAVPVFDRDMELSRNCARLIPRNVEVLVAEGNYLLLDLPGWRDLAPSFDLTVSLDIPVEVLRERLYARWRYHGLSDADIPSKVEGNDIPNGLTVINRSRSADIVLSLADLS